MASINSLPDEVILSIMKMAAQKRGFWVWPEEKYDHDFLVVLCKVSIRFRRLATDDSLWRGCVVIHPLGDLRKTEFVVQKCLNSKTKTFDMIAGRAGAFRCVPYTLQCPSPGLVDVDPTARFPNLKLASSGASHRTYHHDEGGSEDTKEA